VLGDLHVEKGDRQLEVARSVARSERISSAADASPSGDQSGSR
jgi:hypothetical protein